MRSGSSTLISPAMPLPSRVEMWSTARVAVGSPRSAASIRTLARYAMPVLGEGGEVGVVADVHGPGLVEALAHEVARRHSGPLEVPGFERVAVLGAHGGRHRHADARDRPPGFAAQLAQQPADAQEDR